MINQQVIERLRNDADYYGAFGDQFLSNSAIGDLINNPKAFGKQRPDGKNLVIGRYFHHLLLEPEKAADTPIIDVSTRNTKEYKNSMEQLGMEVIMLRSEAENTQKIAAEIKSNIFFFDEIYREGNLFEEPAIGMIKGHMFKGKADVVGHDFIIGLKTTSDMDRFIYSARQYNYDSQAYIYQQLFGKPLVFFVVDKETYNLGVYRPTDNFIRNGEFKVEKALEIYEKYFGPKATDDIQNYYVDQTLE